jgi:hypothetical protein
MGVSHIREVVASVWRKESADKIDVDGNVHFGGFVGYSSGNATSSLNKPPSQMVFSFPGTPHSHLLRSIMPLAPRMGFAKKPKGWSRRHDFLAAALAEILCAEEWRRIPLF